MLKGNRERQDPPERWDHRGYLGSMAAGDQRDHEDEMGNLDSPANKDLPVDRVVRGIPEPTECLVGMDSEVNLDLWESQVCIM